MANSLSGSVSLDVLAQGWLSALKRQQGHLVGQGYSEEQAWAIVASQFNDLAWNMGTHPSPLGGNV